MDRLTPFQLEVTNSLSSTFNAAGEELYLVGGIVRDALLNRARRADLDLATSAGPPRTRELLASAGASSVYLVGERFGTIGAIFGNESDRLHVEVTTYRRETYPDHDRFPEVDFDATLTDDLARRDFTMNALAIEPTSGELIDPWGGEADIAQSVVRAVGSPDERFAEDPLRLLRAARFVSQLGFRLDWRTEEAMGRQAPTLARISRERILSELTLLLLGNYVDHGLDALRRTKLLQAALPELEPLAAEAETDLSPRLGREKDLWEHTIRVVRQCPPRAPVRWAALLHDAGKPHTRSVGIDGEVHFFGHERVGAEIAERALARLNADRALRVSVRTLVALHGRPAAYDSTWSDSAVRRLALDTGDAWEDLLDLAAADVTSGREQKRNAASRRVSDLRARFRHLQEQTELARLASPLDGNDLMRMFNRSPGPWIKHVKNHLRDLVIEGVLLPDDRIGATTIASEVLAGIDSPNGSVASEPTPGGGSSPE